MSEPNAPGDIQRGTPRGVDERGRLLVDVQGATRAVDAADVTLALGIRRGSGCPAVVPLTAVRC